ncbi:conserved hypothetical protein [gamma proteobacterium HTCC5015]|nr:conserved hypothetical protein [gamma proteobacterium HTCC5015]
MMAELERFWVLFGLWVDSHRLLFTVLGVIGFLVSIGSLLILPWLFARLPADYFINPEYRRWNDLAPKAIVKRVLRNVLGVCLIFLGVVMLPLPGQGLLTIVAGVLLVDFPGKFRFECWLLRRPGVRRGINWLRHKAKREPLAVRSSAAK